MKDFRIKTAISRGEPFEIEMNGESVTAFKGETIAAALTAAGKMTLNLDCQGKPNGYYCGIGICWNCIVEIDGVPNRRACHTPAYPGCKVRTQEEVVRWKDKKHENR